MRYSTLLAVSESGSGSAIHSANLLTDARSQIRGGVLAEPFPWAGTQGVILMLVIVNSQI
jgi:hypothetical protein